MRKRLVTALSATAMFCCALAASPASANTSQALSPASIAGGCTEWFDSAGPGGAGRYHVDCQGNIYVQATVWCKDGSMSVSAWRYSYAKAECPYGVKAASGDFDTRV